MIGIVFCILFQCIKGLVTLVGERLDVQFIHLFIYLMEL